MITDRPASHPEGPSNPGQLSMKYWQVFDGAGVMK